jgi:hypothetical protein
MLLNLLLLSILFNNKYLKNIYLWAVVLCTVHYFKNQTGLKILPRDRSRTRPHLNVNQKPKLDWTDGFM